MRPILTKATPLALLVLAALVAGAMPASATTVTVTLKVDASITFPFNEPAFTAGGTACDVTVSAGADGSAILDAAQASGCIDDWSSSFFDCCGSLLTGIKGHGQAAFTNERNTFATIWPCQTAPAELPGDIVASSWVGLLNPPGPGDRIFLGLDQYAAQDGDVLEFAYVVDTCAFVNALAVGAANAFVGSPVPLQGSDLTDPGSL